MTPQDRPWMARRYCKGDGAWSRWQPCTDEQRKRWLADGEPFQFKPTRTDAAMKEQKT
jgi:hypothetical protein